MIVWRNPIKVSWEMRYFSEEHKTHCNAEKQYSVWSISSHIFINIIRKKYKKPKRHYFSSWYLEKRSSVHFYMQDPHKWLSFWLISPLFRFFFTPIHQFSFYISRSVRVSITPSAILNDLCNSCLCGADLHVHFTTETLWGSANYRLLSNNCTFVCGPQFANETNAPERMREGNKYYSHNLY